MTCRKPPRCVADLRDKRIPRSRWAYRLKQQGESKLARKLSRVVVHQVKHQKAEAVLRADQLFGVDFIETELLLKSSTSAPNSLLTKSPSIDSV